jgi:hypothetical protein
MNQEKAIFQMVLVSRLQNKEIGMHKINRLCAVLLLIVFVVTGCSTKRRYGHNYSNSHSRSNSDVVVKEEVKVKEITPDAINVVLKIDNWVIRENRILGYDKKLGKIRFAGKYSYGGDLVFKFKSDKSSLDKYYWLGVMPDEKNGTFEVRADWHKEYSQEIEPLKEPMQSFNVFIKVKNRTIKKFDISGYKASWGKFKVDKVKKKVMFMINPWYPGSVWAAKLPVKNGSWTIKFKKIR